MTLAVVSTSFQPRLQAKSVEDTGPPATDPQHPGLDFASILLGLPVAAASPLPEDDKPDKHEMIIADAGTGAAATDPQFLATLGYLPSPDLSEVAGNSKMALSLPIGTEGPLPSTSARIGPDTQEIRAQSSDDRQQSASALLAADDKPAKFAVTQFTVPSAKQSGTSTPSSPGTLAAMPSPAQSGLNTFELGDPASSPGTLAAMPSPAQSGLNTFELGDPASSPGTLAAMPSLAQSGLNTFELGDPAGSPGTLAAMPSLAQSGLNTPQLRDPAGSPGTLAAMLSLAQSGLNTSELRDPAGSPGTLAAMPSPAQSGLNTPQLRDPAGSPGTLAAMPSLAQSGLNTFELGDPASSPGTLAAMPSPAQSGLNTFELVDPASNPGTLAAMPSLAQSGLNTSELRDPAGSPGTLAAMPSPAESGLNTPQLRDLAGSPGTLAAIPSSAQSGLNTPQLRDPASQPNMLSTMPPPPEPGPNTTELRDPASSPSTLAAVPGNAMSGAAVTDHITDHLRTPLRDSSWAGDLGQKLLWFASNEKQLAHLTLHPPQLGSIEITLNLEKDGATAHFVSPNADVRGAIETAVPRLREMFAGTGIALGQVSVGSESFRQQPDGQQESSHRPRPQADNAILGSDSANGLSSKTFVTQRGHGLIDIFA